AGEVVVTVRRDPSLEDGLLFSVRDTGIGIPRDRMNRLFQAFSQIDSSTTRMFGGSGLGLVISKRLVELMGGSVTVESEVGSGSTFSFSIVGKALKGVKPQVSLDPEPCLTGHKVLVIDDHS